MRVKNLLLTILVISIANSPTMAELTSKIAFVSSRDLSNDVFIMNADGSDPVNISRNPDYWDTSPAWSPVADYPTAVTTPSSWGEIKRSWR